jgi:hypothetical protein
VPGLHAKRSTTEVAVEGPLGARERTRWRGSAGWGNVHGILRRPHAHHRGVQVRPNAHTPTIATPNRDSDRYVMTMHGVRRKTKPVPTGSSAGTGQVRHAPTKHCETDHAAAPPAASSPSISAPSSTSIEATRRQGPSISRGRTGVECGRSSEAKSEMSVHMRGVALFTLAPRAFSRYHFLGDDQCTIFPDS